MSIEETLDACCCGDPDPVVCPRSVFSFPPGTPSTPGQLQVLTLELEVCLSDGTICTDTVDVTLEFDRHFPNNGFDWNPGSWNELGATVTSITSDIFVAADVELFIRCDDAWECLAPDDSARYGFALAFTNPGSRLNDHCGAEISEAIDTWIIVMATAPAAITSDMLITAGSWTPQGWNTVVFPGPSDCGLAFGSVSCADLGLPGDIFVDDQSIESGGTWTVT